MLSGTLHSTTFRSWGLSLHQHQSYSIHSIRVGFQGEDGPFEFYTKDILHLGVSPGTLLERAKQRFLAAGGVVRDNTSIEGVRIAPNGAAVDVAGLDEAAAITGRLVIDCMGNQSPISRQHRWGQQPDGICIVVGTCASGFVPEKNTFADLMYSFTPTQKTRRDGASQVQVRPSVGGGAAWGCIRFASRSDGARSVLIDVCVCTSVHRIMQ